MPLAQKINKKYTYADYLTWDDDERWEIIEGVVYDMGPAPLREHQRIAAIIFNELYNFLKGRKCEVYFAPFDVRFEENNESSEEEIETVVQPDIVVICDDKKLNKKGCLGAPDLVVEILSPSTAYKDETEKLKLYEKHGVKEYWIVNPEANYMMIYHRVDNKYGKPDYLMDDDIIESSVLKGFSVNCREIFADKLKVSE